MTAEHWSRPLRLAGDGRVATVAQGSFAEVGQAAQLVLQTRVGERVDMPDFGSPEPLPGDGADVAGMRAALQLWEPRCRILDTAFASGGGAAQIRLQIELVDDDQDLRGAGD